MKRMILFLCAGLWLIGCGKSSLQMAHTLPSDPGGGLQKPSADCLTKTMEVQVALANTPGFDPQNTRAMSLGSGRCAVRVMMFVDANASVLAAKMKDKFGYYSFIPAPSGWIEVWYDKPVQARGNIPTDSECEKAKQMLSRAAANVKPIMQIFPNPRSNFRCYVEGTFATNTDFQNYMGRTGEDDLLHIAIAREGKTGAHANVWLHLIAPR